MVCGKMHAMKTRTEQSYNQREKRIKLLDEKDLEQGLSVDEAKELIGLQRAHLGFLQEQFRLAKHKLFASKNEAYPGQGELFNEAEDIAQQSEAELADEAQFTEYTAKRKKRNRKVVDDTVEREVVIHDIDEADKTCDCCQGQMHVMGKDVTEKLEYVPATIKVIENHRLKYACRTCEKNGTKTPIKQAPPVASILPKSYATPSLIAQIIVSKFQYGLPLYRLETMLGHIGIHISRQTMSDWLIKISALFKPITYEPWHDILLKQDYVRCDETTMIVVGDDNVKSYMWVYNCGADSPAGNINGDDTPNIVLYDYQPSRAGKCAADFLRGYEGYLGVDGYAGYHLTLAQLVACLAHMRRKFVEAKKMQGKNAKVGKADWALNQIQKLYRIEKQIKDKTVEERYRIRQEQSLPLLVQFKTWLDKSSLTVLPQSLLGKAINYALNQWAKFIRYIEDGRIDIDNNRSERAIKPFVIGRKAWLISQTSKGANASAILYSIIETAKACGIKPYDYLMYVMQKMMEGNVNPEEILPWKVNLG
jgi:transposase